MVATEQARRVHALPERSFKRSRVAIVPCALHSIWSLAHHCDTESGSPVSSRLFRLLSTFGQPEPTLLKVGVSPTKSSCTTLNRHVSPSGSISQVTLDGGSSRSSRWRGNAHV